MSFLHSEFLIGLLLAGIPIVLHLVMRQRPKPLEFPALRLLKLRKHTNQRKLKLWHWTLLALRVLAVCLMVAGLARPRIQAAGLTFDQEAPVAAALVFDTSYRLEYRQLNQTRLERAQELAYWLLEELPPESDIAVLRPTLSWGDDEPALQSFQPNAIAARQQIERLQFAPAGRPLSSLVEDAVRVLKTSERRKELYLFTDLSKQSWSAPSFAKMQADLLEAGVAVYVIDVGAIEPQNFALGEVQLSSQIISRNSPAELTVDLTRTGAAAKRLVEMYVADASGRELKAGSQEIDLGANESRKLTFPLPRLDLGLHQGRIKIAGEDPLQADNARFFTVMVRPAWRVLVSGPWPPGDGQTLHGSAYVIEALAPDELRKKDEARFDTTYVPLSELARQPLADYAAVFVLDPGPLTNETWDALRMYVQRGGGLLISLGRRATKAEFNSERPQGLLAGKLDYVGRAPDRNGVSLSPNNFSHPMLSRFRTIDGGVPWNLFPIFRFWKLADLVEGARVVIPFNHKLPALIERPIGAGRALTLTTPISDPPIDAWNELATDWPWVMLAEELTLYLAGESEGNFNYQVGETPDLRADASDRSAQFVVYQPDNETYRAQVDPQSRAIEVLPPVQPGNYHLRSGQSEGGQQLGFSANLSPDESDLERLTPEGLKSAFGDYPYQVAREQSDVERAQNNERIGQEWFPMLAVILALVLAVEFALATWFYSSR